MQHLLTLNYLLWRMPGGDVMSGMVHGLLSEKKQILEFHVCLIQLLKSVDFFLVSEPGSLTVSLIIRVIKTHPSETMKTIRDLKS